MHMHATAIFVHMCNKKSVSQKKCVTKKWWLKATTGSPKGSQTPPQELEVRACSALIFQFLKNVFGNIWPTYGHKQNFSSTKLFSKVVKNRSVGSQVYRVFLSCFKCPTPSKYQIVNFKEISNFASLQPFLSHFNKTLLYGFTGLACT